ncbi:dual OB domain-containing protein [Syntrophomonas wolfei]|jgi:hypothetical protein|uniref:dual OB domain-containing protein n=1 Tax=Syntrophomonas wolfei TaxID=863 RepID=UPI000EEDB4DB|nr:hypothetical protein [Syntrophomonas wolfei]HCX79017.1 hypothetical protein [Bacillota bacterium]
MSPFICLANSNKNGGRCIAGKDLDSYKWIRPVSDSVTGELSLLQYCYENGREPNLLDIVGVTLKEPKPQAGQPENHLIAASEWKYYGTFPKKEIARLCDEPENLWMLDYKADRVSSNTVISGGINQSLYLIKPDQAILSVGLEYGKLKVRANFNYKGQAYSLVVTDPNYLIINTIGSYPLCQNTYLTISLGQEFKGYCYKLVAGIIEPNSSYTGKNIVY